MARKCESMHVISCAFNESQAWFLSVRHTESCTIIYNIQYSMNSIVIA
jgi:hypothetical protein